MNKRRVETTDEHRAAPAYAKEMYACARSMSKQTHLGFEKCLEILEKVGPTYVLVDDDEKIVGLSFFRPKVIVEIKRWKALLG